MSSSRLEVAGAGIKIVVDEMQRDASGAVARRLRTGRKPKEAGRGLFHALMQEAVRQSAPGVRFDVHYLTGDESQPMALSSKVMENRLETIREALTALGCGDFPADPKDDDACPRCPHYFICPSVPI